MTRYRGRRGGVGPAFEGIAIAGDSLLLTRFDGRRRDGWKAVRPPHYLLGDSVGLLFERIIDSADGEFWLQVRASR